MTAQNISERTVLFLTLDLIQQAIGASDRLWFCRPLGHCTDSAWVGFCIGVPSMKTSSGYLPAPAPFEIILFHPMTQSRKRLWFGASIVEAIDVYNTYDNPEEVDRWMATVRRNRLPERTSVS